VPIRPNRRSGATIRMFKLGTRRGGRKEIGWRFHERSSYLPAPPDEQATKMRLTMLACRPVCGRLVELLLNASTTRISSSPSPACTKQTQQLVSLSLSHVHVRIMQPKTAPEHVLFKTHCSIPRTVSVEASRRSEHLVDIFF